MHELVDLRGLQYDIELLDIQQPNDRLFRGESDVIKVSFAAAAMVAGDYWVLPSGSALGFGVGPLLLAATADSSPADAEQVTFCPGEHTTAHHLFRHFYAGTSRVEQVVFSDIMPALQERRADFGVCIHEGRFTWQAEGLHLVEDLGTRWEKETGGPLPLGGILAHQRLGAEVAGKVQATLRESIEFAQANPDSALPTMRQHAQEFDDAVLMQHVDLYVNDWTLDLGEVGQQALNQVSTRFKLRHGLVVDPLAREVHGLVLVQVAPFDDVFLGDQVDLVLGLPQRHVDQLLVLAADVLHGFASDV